MSGPINTWRYRTRHEYDEGGEHLKLIPRYNFTEPGVYELQVSGRSKNFFIDRIVLYDESRVGYGASQDTTLSESARVVQSPPVSDPTSKHLFFMVASSVVSDYWTSITMSETFTSMVAVCSVQYDSGNLIPAVVRMRNVGAKSFEIRLQNPSNTPITIGRNVHCLVAEKGSWKLPDGRKFEAQSYKSTVTDHKSQWVGQKQTYLNSYESTPTILGQVMSSNSNFRWSVFWSCGANRYATPSATQLNTGKHVGEDPATSRYPEMIGYIVVEEGHGSMAGFQLEAGRVGSDGFDAPFSVAPTVVVVGQMGMRGNDGSWAVLREPPNTLTMSVAVDEDQTNDGERYHTNETTSYFVFSGAGALQLTPAD